MNSYEIDEKAGTIKLWVDRDTNSYETASLDDLVGLLFWLKSREDDLRYMVHKAYPMTIRRPFTTINGYMVAIAIDEASGRGMHVKIKADMYQAYMRDQEKIIRDNWLAVQNDQRALRNRGPVVEFVRGDNTGRVIPQPVEPELTEADAPLQMVNQRLMRYQKPEYWASRPENLDAGKWLKLP